MAERNAEVEFRLKGAATTVTGLRDKLKALQTEYKEVKSEEAATKGQASPSSGGEEAKLNDDSDLISKLYNRVCVLNKSLVETRKRTGHIEPPPMASLRQSSPRLLPRPNREFVEDLGSPSSPISTTRELETERMFQNAEKRMEAVNVKLQDAGSKFEAAEDQLHDASKTITLLRDRVRILTDEVKQARAESPELIARTDGTVSPFRTGVGSPFKPSSPAIKLEEPNSVLVHRMEDSLAQAQERCRVLNLEISYLEKKRVAAVDAIKTLDAAIADKSNALRIAEEEVKRMRRCLKRDGVPEEASSAQPSKGRLQSLLKVFKKPEHNVEKYMIKQQAAFLCI